MRFTNSDETLDYLRKHTELEWEEVTPVYLHFKTYYNPHRQFCVFASPDWIRKGPLAKFYIPKDGEELHDPKRFLEYLTNKKEQLVKSMPWIVVHLDSLGELKRTLVTPYYVATMTFSLEGTLKLRQIGSLNNLAMGVGFSKYMIHNSKLEATTLIDKFAVSLSLDSNELSFGESLLGPYGTTTVTVKGNEITAELIPTPNVQRQVIGGWEVEGEVGYKMTGRIDFQSPPGIVPVNQPVSSTNEGWLGKTVEEVAAMASATIVFVRAIAPYVLGAAALAG